MPRVTGWPVNTAWENPALETLKNLFLIGPHGMLKKSLYLLPYLNMKAGLDQNPPPLMFAF